MINFQLIIHVVISRCRQLITLDNYKNNEFWSLDCFLLRSRWLITKLNTISSANESFRLGSFRPQTIQSKNLSTSISICAYDFDINLDLLSTEAQKAIFELRQTLCSIFNKKRLQELQSGTSYQPPHHSNAFTTNDRAFVIKSLHRFFLCDIPKRSGRININFHSA